MEGLKDDSRRRELHRRYDEMRAAQVAHYGTPYEGIFNDLTTEAIEDIIDYYEKALNIAPNSGSISLQK